jgi:monoterpene epsilon-lactone hydrolase
MPCPQPSLPKAIFMAGFRFRQAGVDAFLQVYEGMAHAHIRDDTAPESRKVFEEIAGFFDHHLDK